MMRQCGCPVELGIPFQAIARVIALSIVPERLDDDIEVCVDADLCVEARMTRFWGNVGPVEYPLPNGSWWRINERRTRNGGVVQVASDITRWKQAQTALRASEQRAQDFAAASADWFWEMDAGLRFTYVSENHEEASGFQSSAVVGKRRADFIEGVDPASRERHFRTLRERQPFRDFVYRRKHGSGEEVWINASGLPVFGEDGSFLGYRGVARNVTEKLRAETALRESEQRLRDLLDGSIQGILIHRDLRPLFVNRAWAEIHGYTVREVMAMETVTDLFHTDDFARMNDYRLARLRGEEAPDRYEYRGVRKDGSFCWIELQASVIAWDGAPAVLAAAVDITNRKAAEEQLRRSEQKYRSMLNSTSEGYWLIDAAGKTVEVNAALCRMLEYDAEDFVGKSPLDFSQGENHAAFAAQMARIPREGQRTYEVVLNKRSGEEVIAYFNATTLFDEDGKAVGSFALIRDETARRRSENQLRQAQKMEAIGQLSGGIAHDFNNLLVPILGLSKISARLLPDDSPAKSNMDKIGQAADRARKLVDQILAFSRKDKAERAALSLGRLVSEALTLLRSSLPTTIRIEHDVLEGDDTVLADETQLFQVLLNLGSNARHAMGIEGGVLSIRLAGEHLATPLHVQTATLEPGPYLHLTISDTGCGMPPERVARVFDPFYTTKEVGEGTGLGLSVVHGIVESHGGGIDVESAVGQGTALHIYLPRAAEEALVSDDPTSECVADASRHLQPANPPSMVNPATHT
jgi:PAS domain S-box-containing protein